ncbi:hypothetical protein [Lactiplantibacillus pingfangensis]|uniref:hypothetical protein n=1 Tax=Lactiplantibacillus pingfangensis TaxID=2559915 RepID=UPI0010F9E796|nr:hypothetical protein [Lactiplantibacillus pingfangensis]
MPRYVGIRGMMALTFCLIGLSSPEISHAQTSPNLVTDTHYVPYRGLQSGGILGGFNQQLRVYPKVVSITANNLSPEGRLTAATTEMAVTFSGHISVFDGFGKTNAINRLEIAVMSGGILKGKPAQPVKIIGTEPNDKSYSNSFFFNSNQHTIRVDLHELKSDLPLAIGFRLMTAFHPDDWTMYYLGAFMPGTLEKPPTMDSLLPTSTHITGHGTPGNEIMTAIDPKAKTTVLPDGSYDLPLSTDLTTYLAKNGRVTVTERNPIGDNATATQLQLKLSHAAQNPEFYLEDEVALTPDNVVDSIVNKLDFQVANVADVQFKTSLDQRSLAEKLDQLAAGQTIEVPIYATKAGFIQSEPIIVKVARNDAGLAFGQSETTLDFGLVNLPLVPTNFSPNTTFKITVHDHRHRATPWKLSAQTKAVDQQPDLGPYLHYIDENSQEQSLTHSVTIYQKKVTDQTDLKTEISFGSKDSGSAGQAALRQLFVRTDPGMKIGKYATAIIWTLADAP